MDRNLDTYLQQAASTGIGAEVERRWQRIAVDPVTLQVVGGALKALSLIHI